MANKEKKFGEIVTIKEEYKIGNLYKRNLLQKYEMNKVRPVVDIDSNNFHFLLDEEMEEEILEEVCPCIDQVRESLEKNLNSLNDNSIKIETNHKNKSDGSISKDTGYLVMDGKRYSHLFRYIWITLNGIKYELNFMRFFIDDGNTINCVLESAQFDRTCTENVNAKGVCYSRTPFEQKSELTNIIKSNISNHRNFCYNPVASIFDPEALSTEFIDFICRCERNDCHSSVENSGNK